MNPGELNTRIPFFMIIENDTLDFSDEAYRPYKKIWAKVKYMSAKETYTSDANNVLNRVNLVIRTRKDITNDMRFLLDKVPYEIKGIRPFDKRKMYLLVTGEIIKHE